LQVALAAVSTVASGEWTGKLLVLGMLFVAALTSFRAAPTDGAVGRAVASVVYVVNPFVYGRLQYGQLFVLVGYALLPWVAIRLRQLLAHPGLMRGLLLAIALTLVGVASSHLLLVASVLIATQLLAHMITASNRLDYIRRIGPGVLAAAGAALIGSSYWLVPLLVGRGQIAATVAGMTTSDVSAFAAVPDQRLGLLPNLLGLYGFWAENTGRFTSMKAFVPVWPAILSLLLIVCAIGAVVALRRRNQELAPWTAGLIAAAVLALFLEMGVSHPWSSGAVIWLDGHASLYRGMRDAGKWAAALGLVYSQLAAVGVTAILDWLKNAARGRSRSEWATSLATGMLLALPLYNGNGLLYGAHGEIKPSQYPVGWYSADRALAADPHPGRTLFLPWHEYIGYSFIRNQNKVVASPAPSFFSVPIVSSADAEVPGIAAPRDPEQVAISALVHSSGAGQWAQVLAADGIKYVLVAHESDWSSYSFLDAQPGLTKIGDYSSITLYLVTPGP
jgi:hypothetical protein